MSFTHWLSDHLVLSSRTPGRAARPASKRKAPAARRTFRPSLDCLEDRLCPSTLIDAHALTMPTLTLDSSVAFSTAAVFSADLSAGTHTLFYGNGVGPLNTVAFSVDNSGAVDYDPSLNAVLSGRGSSTLVVNGVTVQIDAHALTMPNLLLNFDVGFATATPFSATLLPGVQSLLYANGVAPLDIVAFSVDNSGAVDYDSSLNAVLSGRNSSTLVVNGVTVQIDAHALTMPGLALNFDVNLATAAPFSATLLPGVQSLLYANGVGPLNTVAFSVDNSGAVDYDPSLNAVLSGRASSTLVVNGVTVQIDARALTIPGLTLNYDVNFATAAPFSATLLPGVQSLLYVNGAVVAFSVNNSGAVDYDPSLDGELSGRGTATLVFRGFTTTVTAADATYDGLPHGATAVVTPGSLAGTTTFLYTGTGYSSRDAPINAGTYHVVATFTPDEPSAYHASSGSADYTISKATLTGNATTQNVLNLAQGTFTITVSNVSGLASGDTLASFLSTAHYYITVGTIRYEFVPTTVTTSGSSITIAYTLRNSALLGELGAALDAATSGATAVSAGFDMESMNYTFTDDYLTRLFSTVR